MSTSTASERKGRSAKNGLTRKPIRPGEMLIKQDFLRDTNQGHFAWISAKQEAAKMGIRLAFQHGRQVFISTDAWIQYLKSRPEKKCDHLDSEADEASPVLTSNPAPVAESRGSADDSAEVADYGSADGA